MTRYWWSERVGPGFQHSFEVELLYEERTPHQHMLIFDTVMWGRMLVLDGVVQLTERDEAVYHEMMVHVPLLGRRRPAETVLIVGGGDGGAAREVLLHDSVQRVVQVELDQAVVQACQRFLPGFCDVWDDPRLELVFEDGLDFVKRVSERGEAFDVILLDTTDPLGPALALFQKAFYQDLAGCLGEDGVVVRQCGPPLTMPEVMPLVMKAMRTVLPGARPYRAPVPSFGDEMAFVAAARDVDSLLNPREELERRYYNPECHRAAFSLPAWWRKLIDVCENDPDLQELPSYSVYNSSSLRALDLP